MLGMPRCPGRAYVVLTDEAEAPKQRAAKSQRVAGRAVSIDDEEQHSDAGRSPRQRSSSSGGARR